MNHQVTPDALTALSPGAVMDDLGWTDDLKVQMAFFLPWLLREDILRIPC